MRHRHQLRQKPRTLIARPEAVDHPRCHIVDRQIRGRRHASRGELLEDERSIDPAEPAAAELVPDINPGEAQRRRAAQCLYRKFLALVPAGRLRQPLLAGKVPRRLGKGPLLG
jgi:hypothetical protein